MSPQCPPLEHQLHDSRNSYTDENTRLSREKFTQHFYNFFLVLSTGLVINLHRRLYLYLLGVTSYHRVLVRLARCWIFVPCPMENTQVASM